MIRLPLDEALVSISGVLVSLFVQEQLPESHIQQIVVGDVAARCQIFLNRFRALHVGKTDTDYAECVIDHFPFGTRQLLQLDD